MKKPIIFAAVGACSLLALVGCSSEDKQSENEPMSSSSPMSSDAPMSEPMSERTVEPTKEATPEEPISAPEPVEEPNTDGPWVRIGDDIVSPAATVKYNDFYTFENGLSLSLEPFFATYEMDLDKDGPVNNDLTREWYTGGTFRNDSNEALEYGTQPLSYRIIQNGNTISEGQYDFYSQYKNSKKYDTTLQPGETIGIFTLSGTVHRPDGPITVVVGYENPTPTAVLFTE